MKKRAGAIIVCGAGMLTSPFSTADDGQLLSLSCTGCHSPAAASHKKTAVTDQDAVIPALSQLSAAQIEAKLLAFKKDTTPATVMNRIAKGYSTEQIVLLAHALGRHD